jgi:hypothetical protein
VTQRYLLSVSAGDTTISTASFSRWHNDIYYHFQYVTRYLLSVSIGDTSISAANSSRWQNDTYPHFQWVKRWHLLSVSVGNTRILYRSYRAWLLVKYEIGPTNALRSNVFTLQHLQYVLIYITQPSVEPERNACCIKFILKTRRPHVSVSHAMSAAAAGLTQGETEEEIQYLYISTTCFDPVVPEDDPTLPKHAGLTCKYCKCCKPDIRMCCAGWTDFACYTAISAVSWRG